MRSMIKTIPKHVRVKKTVAYMYSSHIYILAEKLFIRFLKIMDFVWLINKALRYDSRELISKLESIIAVFILIILNRGRILYNL